jgi:DNA-binding IclR family transcriptional regulator
VILAGLPSTQLRKFLDSQQQVVAAAGLPTDWPGFRRYYARIRKDGFYFSNGELESDLAAIAVPLTYADGSITGALSLVTTVQRMSVVDPGKLTPLIQRAAREICSRLD